jgi:glutamyl-tRNA synthetase
VEPSEKAAGKWLGPERSDYLLEVAARLETLEPWETGAIERTLRELKAERELSSNQAFMPVRVAVTGSEVSPPLFESVELLGRERSVERLRKAASAPSAT